MISRFVTLALLASAFTLAIQAQDNSVLIGPPHSADRVVACASDGREFLSHRPADPAAGAAPESLIGASRDGTLATFQIPQNRRLISAAASDDSDLSVLTDDPNRPRDFEIDRFDSQGSLLARRPLQLDFRPDLLAVLPSGKMVLLGVFAPEDYNNWKNVAAVVDADGQMLKRTAFPLPREGGGWTFDSHRMLAADGAAFIMLHSYDPPATGLAKILEDGNIEIKIIPNSSASGQQQDERRHIEWLFGPDVAVEMYHYVGTRERCTSHFDEYDLNTGEKTASRYALLRDGAMGCYSGSEASVLAQISSAIPAEGIFSNTLRIVFGRLQDQPESKPVSNQYSCLCALNGGHCPGAESAAAKP